jgi:hypothetical protein
MAGERKNINKAKIIKEKTILDKTTKRLDRGSNRRCRPIAWHDESMIVTEPTKE